MTKKAYILRGIPGSGKSSLAAEIVTDAGRIHSTDQYFVVGGQYRFDPQQLQTNHDKNFAAFQHSIDEEVPVVICDNTNVKKWEYARYRQAAEEAGYVVRVISLEHPEPEIAFERCVHGVPLETIKKMVEEWEY